MWSGGDGVRDVHFKAEARRVGRRSWVMGGGYPRRTRDMEAASAERVVAGKRTGPMSGAHWPGREERECG